MRFTFPALITSSIKLCRRYKNRDHLVSNPHSQGPIFNFFKQSIQESDWQTKVSPILKFARQLTSILATTVEAPTIALRLFLLSAQVADECGFEDLAYDFYVQAFSVYEDSISESRAQLQAITLIIGTLAGAKVFSVDNFDTLITKAALHGSKLLKKSHQATAVGLASHLWWQEAAALMPNGKEEEEMDVEGQQVAKSKVVENLQQLCRCRPKRW
jgi:vacuolar protein sorting-associated protein 35